MKVKLKDVKANPSNPRVIKDEQFKKLVKSIEEFPEMLSVRKLVCTPDMVVLGGNMRLRALQSLGVKEVEVEVVDWDEAKQKEFVVKDNLGYGEWDWESLANEWDVEELADWGLDIPNLDTTVLEAEEDNYEIPEDIKCDVVLGDLIEIGEHRLLCGDSTQADTFDKLFGTNTADMVVTDPPYNVAYEGKTKDKLKIVNDNMSDNEFYQFLYDFYTALNSFCKPGAAWYVWHAPSEIVNFAKAFQDAGILLKQQLIWVKNTLVMGRQDYQWKHEPCLYGWKEGGAHNWYNDRKQTTVLEYNKPNRNSEHPTMKPVELISYQINNSSKKNQIVADAFLGSGTTMVACNQLQRICYGVEYDPKYCQVIIDRMAKLDPSLKIKINGKEYKAQ